MHGSGTYTYASKTVFEGDFLYNERTEKAVSFRNGSDHYVGFISKNNLKNGPGTLKSNYLSIDTLFKIKSQSGLSQIKLQFCAGYKFGVGILIDPEQKQHPVRIEFKFSKEKFECTQGQEVQEYLELEKVNAKKILSIFEEYDESGRLTYLGQGIKQTKFGTGTYYFRNNECYKGQFYNDMFSGDGVYHFNNGSIYQGNFRNSIMDGAGSFFYENGDEFQGKFRNNKKEGFGLYKHLTKEFLYQEYSGVFKNDDLEEGEFKIDQDSDSKIGRFDFNTETLKFYYNNDQDEQIGEISQLLPQVPRDLYVNSFKTETDKEILKHAQNSDILEENKKQSSLIEVFGLGNVKLENNFTALCKGEATVDLLDNSHYTGQFLDNMLQGIGRLMMGEKLVYEGEFLRNKRHGKGKSFSNDGQELNGIFFQDIYLQELNEEMKKDEEKKIDQPSSESQNDWRIEAEEVGEIETAEKPSEQHPDSPFQSDREEIMRLAVQIIFPQGIAKGILDLLIALFSKTIVDNMQNVKKQYKEVTFASSPKMISKDSPEYTKLQNQIQIHFMKNNILQFDDYMFFGYLLAAHLECKSENLLIESIPSTPIKYLCYQILLIKIEKIKELKMEEIVNFLTSRLKNDSLYLINELTGLFSDLSLSELKLLKGFINPQDHLSLWYYQSEHINQERQDKLLVKVKSFSYAIAPSFNLDLTKTPGLAYIFSKMENFNEIENQAILNALIVQSFIELNPKIQHYIIQQEKQIIYQKIKSLRHEESKDVESGSKDILRLIKMIIFVKCQNEMSSESKHFLENRKIPQLKSRITLLSSNHCDSLLLSPFMLELPDLSRLNSFLSSGEVNKNLKSLIQLETDFELHYHLAEGGMNRIRHASIEKDVLSALLGIDTVWGKNAIPRNKFKKVKNKIQKVTFGTICLDLSRVNNGLEVYKEFGGHEIFWIQSIDFYEIDSSIRALKIQYSNGVSSKLLGVQFGIPENYSQFKKTLLITGNQSIVRVRTSRSPQLGIEFKTDQGVIHQIGKFDEHHCDGMVEERKVVCFETAFMPVDLQCPSPDEQVLYHFACYVERE